MRVILDVNVWISALLWGGVPDQVLILAESKRVSLFASEALFIELETTLRRAKIWIADGSTLEALRRKLKTLKEKQKPLAGKIMMVVEAFTHRESYHLVYNQLPRK